MQLNKTPENGETHFIVKADRGFILRMEGITNGEGKTIHLAGSGDINSVGIDTSFVGLISVFYSSDDNKWWMVINKNV